MTVLDRLSVPVVLAPLAGGPSTPGLAAAVANSGGLGFLAAGYLTAAQLGERLAHLRALTDRQIGINVFAPGLGPADPQSYEPYVSRLADWAHKLDLPIGAPRHSDDDWQGKLELLLRESVPVVSFTFGRPESPVIEALHRAGSEVWVTVTSAEEAIEAERAGADVLVAQGAEAGGHRASFIDRPDLPLLGLMALLSRIRAATSVPVVASGGIATESALSAACGAGARAAQVGTAFMLCPEAGTSEVHRAAIKTDSSTELTRAFTGRLARGIHNGFMAEHSEGAPIAYPEIHYVTAPLRQLGRDRRDPDLVNLWAGEAHVLAQEVPAAEAVRQLIGG